jgi:homocysteine S-methyltransferase
MKIEDFEKTLHESVMVADGAMGSLLYETLGPQRSMDELNVTRAEEVFRIHKAYLEAGAHIIETNTFGANRNKLSALGLEERVTELNHRGVKIAREAREAARHEVLIAGSIGPLGINRQVRALPPEQVREIVREQAEALEERGVDFFILETFSDLGELVEAVGAIRSFSQLPIVAQLTYSEEGSTFSGARPRDAWAALHQLGIQAIGANCSVGPQDHLRILQELAQVAGSFPLSSLPNVGFPQRSGDRVIYPKSSPEYFELFARDAAALGARILGGCCGTTPEHIRAMVQAVEGLRPGKRAQASAAVVAAPEARPLAAREPESSLWRKIQAGKFVVSVEIDPPKGTSIDRVLEQVGRVMASKCVDAIDINSGPLARVGMDALALAGALEARGVETIPHLTTRDANLIGLDRRRRAQCACGHRRSAFGQQQSGDFRRVRGGLHRPGQGPLASQSGHRLGRERAWRRNEFYDRRGCEPHHRGPRRGVAALRGESEGRRALRDDPAHLRSGALGRISKADGRQIADSRAAWDLAAEQLQAGSPAQ